MTLESTADTRIERDGRASRNDEAVAHLAAALRTTKDRDVRYHVREALQLLQSETDRTDES